MITILLGVGVAATGLFAAFSNNIDPKTGRLSEEGSGLVSAFLLLTAIQCGVSYYDQHKLQGKLEDVAKLSSQLVSSVEEVSTTTLRNATQVTEVLSDLEIATEKELSWRHNQAGMDALRARFDRFLTQLTIARELQGASKELLRLKIGEDDWETTLAGLLPSFGDGLKSSEDQLEHAALTELIRRVGGTPMPDSSELAGSLVARVDTGPQKQEDREKVLQKHMLTVTRWRTSLLRWCASSWLKLANHQQHRSRFELAAWKLTLLIDLKERGEEIDESEFRYQAKELKESAQLLNIEVPSDFSTIVQEAASQR